MCFSDALCGEGAGDPHGGDAGEVPADYPAGSKPSGHPLDREAPNLNDDLEGGGGGEGEEEPREQVV